MKQRHTHDEDPELLYVVFLKENLGRKIVGSFDDPQLAASVALNLRGAYVLCYARVTRTG